MRRPIVGLAALAITASACVSDSTGSSIEGITVADGFGLEEAVVGLDGPTQFAVLDDGRLLVAEIGGDENDEAGRITLVDAAEPGGSPQDGSSGTILVDNLDKPTGVAVFDERLWVMERNTLSAGDFAATTDPVELTAVASDLPFNGRSEGTLTPTPDGDALLFNTSGRIRDGDVVEGSGELRAINTANEETVIATGLKHGYAHVFDASGQLWVTEVSDGDFDGEPATDELVAVTPGDNLGWPMCVGDNRPVAERGGTAESCAAVPPSLATFGPRATPTSVVVAPWDDDTLLVALWVTNEVVAVDKQTPGATPIPIVSGASRPQHLVVSGDQVLISEYETGRILVLAAVS